MKIIVIIRRRSKVSNQNSKQSLWIQSSPIYRSIYPFFFFPFFSVKMMMMVMVMMVVVVVLVAAAATYSLGPSACLQNKKRRGGKKANKTNKRKVAPDQNE